MLRALGNALSTVLVVAASLVYLIAASFAVWFGFVLALMLIEWLAGG